MQIPQAVLLAAVLAGVVACDEPLPPAQDTPLFHVTPQQPGSVANIPAGDNNVPPAFSPAKREHLATLIAAHHYQQPAIPDIQPHTATASRLNSYLQSLDAYSKYLGPEEYRFFQARAALERTDIGINLLVHDNGLLAIPLAGSPAYRAGLTRPSRLISLNGGNVDFTDFASYRFLTGLKPGDTIPVKVADPVTGKPHTYTITAGRYQRELAAYTEYGKLGVITIHEFREATTRQVRKFLSQAMQKQALIIDLRYCPGGDLFTAVDMLSLFLPPRLDVVHLVQGQGKPVVLQSLPGQVFKGKPVYLLTSHYTASSAEVFVHAIKKYLPASRTLGEPTTGKCLALEKHELEDGSALELSAYEILTPDKQSCNGHPTAPDINIPGIELLDIRDAVQGLYP